MKIAIVGTGISGLVCAHLLSRVHEVTVFEKNDYVGGHTNTVDVEQDGRTWAVDTGFIVFNEKNYPNFVRLLDRLGVASQPSSMSFSVRCERTGLEYNGTSLDTLFAQRRNLLRPRFYRMLRDILRFNRRATELLHQETNGLTLGDYLAQCRLSREFEEHYLIPMGAAVWSTDPRRMRDFPAKSFVEFFHNHGMLQVEGRPAWRVVRGGSRNYVKALIRSFESRIRLNSPVEAVTRAPDHVLVKARGGAAERFDHVILATHSDQALRSLTDPTPAEEEILGAIGYQENDVVLHTDAAIMPRARRAWASWNYHIPREPSGRVAVTYDMNILQTLESRLPFLVTLNRDDIGQAQVLRRMRYEHPLYTADAIDAQKRHGEISGAVRTHFCGAYWGHGFHEDGVRSALAVCRGFGAAL